MTFTPTEPRAGAHSSVPAVTAYNAHRAAQRRYYERNREHINAQRRAAYMAKKAVETAENAAKGGC